jgi:hypothetical protein
MPDTIPGGLPASDPANPATDADADADADAASLTALLCEFGGLWEITKAPHGYRAQRRPLPAPPLIFTAGTVPGLRELLEHGYDTGKLAGLLRDYAGQWEIEHLDPGSAWAAISRDLTQIITAADLDTLGTTLSHAARQTPNLTGTTTPPAR